MISAVGTVAVGDVNIAASLDPVRRLVGTAIIGVEQRAFRLGGPFDKPVTVSAPGFHVGKHAGATSVGLDDQVSLPVAIHVQQRVGGLPGFCCRVDVAGGQCLPFIRCNVVGDRRWKVRLLAGVVFVGVARKRCLSRIDHQ